MHRTGFIALAMVGSLVLHGGIAFALKRLSRADREPPPEPMQVSFEVKKAEPPPPPPPEPEPEPPPKALPAPQEKKKAIVAPPQKTKAPPVPVNQPPPPPPAGPDEGPPAPQRVVVKFDGQTYVNPGPPGGTATGRPGGTGQGPGGGGPEGSTGTGKVAMATSVKVLPRPIGDYDFSKDYPAEALRREIEGQVVARLLVDENGRVAQKKLVKTMGFGLDEQAMKIASQMKFEPGRDQTDQAVAVWITWTFTFNLPRR